MINGILMNVLIIIKEKKLRDFWEALDEHSDYSLSSQTERQEQKKVPSGDPSMIGYKFLSYLVV